MLGAPLIGLLVGYWVVAARPNDFNAWLVLMIVTFPEAAFGNINPTWVPGLAYAVLNTWKPLADLMAFPALLWFGLFFPERSRIDIRWPRLKWIVLASQRYSGKYIPDAPSNSLHIGNCRDRASVFVPAKMAGLF